VIAVTPGTRRYGLRTRLIGAFGLLALILSLILSVATYLFARDSLLDRREEVAIERAVNNAASLSERSGVLAELSEEEVRDLLETVFTPEGSAALLQIRESYFSSTALLFSEEDLNEDLQARVNGGTPVQMTYELASEPSLVVGIPLLKAGVAAAYFEETSLLDVSDTLRSLSLALLGASALTTLAGVGLGFYAGRTVLAPLTDISGAAARIASGDLSTRLTADPDRDLQQLSLSFNNMATALQERIERDARFASDVSHELRSPLMTLTASIAVLERRREEIPERARVAVDLLSTDVARFAQLVEDLLEISRFDVGAAALELEPLHVPEFVRQSLKYAGHDDIPVVIADDAEDLILEGDKRRLGQVMRNLVDNAAHYGGGATAVLVDRVSDDVEIVVQDQGSGVPKSERDVIFDRFARGSAGGRRGSGTGVGLGLALVREHVRLHGGDVRVEDRPDGKSGAHFVMTLPGAE